MATMMQSEQPPELISKSPVSDYRLKRLEPLIGLIEQVFEAKGQVDIIDIGGTPDYWGMLPQGLMDEKNVYITVVNLPGIKLAPDEGRFKYIHGNGCDLHDLESDQFDISHSNSVIEHVGLWPDMLKFAEESKRVAKHYFIQTPNFWFPIEPHYMKPFIHWLPYPMRIWLLQRMDLGNFQKKDDVTLAMRAIEDSRLLDITMFRYLFEDAEIIKERVGLFVKSFVAIK